MPLPKYSFGLIVLGLTLASGLSAQIYTRSDVDVPPKLTRRIAPLYPYELRKDEIPGMAVVTFIVDETGTLKDCEIAENSNWAFGRAAYSAVRQWRYSPAEKAKHPVQVKMSVPVAFTIHNGSPQISPAQSGFDFYGFQTKGARNLPEEMRYDCPPQPDLLVPPAYPMSFLLYTAQRHTESADVSFLVDPAGHVQRVKILKTNAPLLAGFLSAALEASRFTPASKRGKACWAGIAKHYTFDRYLPESGATGDLLLALRDGGKGIVPASGLDRPLHPLYEVAPVYPEELREKGPAGEAVVEFYIDRDGWARFPQVVSATSEAFGWAAATAASQWQFAPPMKNGKPVPTVVSVPFEFAAPGK